jgi:hypothetical protein
MLMPSERSSHTTHAVFLLDKSGSMGNQRQSIINLYKEMIEAMKSNTTVKFINHLWMFNGDWSYIFGPRPIEEVQPITLDDYLPSGMTSLRDTLMHVIDNLSAVHQLSNADDVIINILTDGEDTSSNHTADECAFYVKKAEARGWKIAYLGQKGQSEQTAKGIGLVCTAYDSLEKASVTLGTAYTNYRGGDFNLQ